MESSSPINFPSPLRDESLYGLFCRYHLLSGNPRVEVTREQLTGQASGWPDRYSSFSIDDVATRIGPVLELTTDQIIDRFTLVPLHVWLGDDPGSMAFRSSRNASFGKVLPSSDPRHRLPVYEPHDLKVCIRCCEEDQATFGAPRWHLVHQPEEITVCPAHGLRLLSGCLWCGHPPSRDCFDMPHLTCQACGRVHSSQAIEGFRSTQLEHDAAQIVKLLIAQTERPRPSWSGLNAEHGLMRYFGLGTYGDTKDIRRFNAFLNSEDAALVEVERSWAGGAQNQLKPLYPGLRSPRAALRGYDVKHEFLSSRRAPDLAKACRLWLLVYASRQWSSTERAIKNYLREGYNQVT